MSDKKFVLKLRNSLGSRRNTRQDSPEKNEDNDRPRKQSKFILPFKRKLSVSPSSAEEKEKPEDTRVAKFRNELKGEFPYPPYGKYIAWTLSCIVILGANFAISYKGTMVDDIESSLWLGISVLSLVLLFFVFQPIIIVLYAVATKYVYDFHRELYYKEIPENVFDNPYDADKDLETKEFRLNNVTSYMPTPGPINQQKRVEIFHRTERSYLLKDATATTILLLVMLIVVISEHSNSAIFFRRTVINLANDGRYTNSIALRNVSSYEQFQEYLTKTLIPALLTNSPNTIDPQPPTNATDGYLFTEIQDRGWTRDIQVKLIGQPRILQKRVQSRSCEGKPSRQDSCQSELNPFNHDSADYRVGWEPLLLGEDELNHIELEPWSYKTWYEVQGSPWFGRLASCFTYGQGGYVVFLGKSEANAKITYDFINYFNWIDYRTRAIFIDFVTYAPGADLFNLATVAFEVSATGVFIPSFRMHTGELLNKKPLNYMIVFEKLGLLMICVGYLIMNEAKKCRTVGITAYFNSFWAVLNAVQAVIGAISVLTTSLAISYDSIIDDELELAAEDQFVNFQVARFWDVARTYSYAFLVTIEVIKIIRYLRYLPHYHQYHRTFAKALPYLLVLSICIVLTCVSFSVIFYQLMGTVDERLSSISGTLTSMYGHTIGTHDTLDASFLNHDLPILNGILFVLFLLTTCYFVLGMIKMILAVDLESVYAEPVQFKNHPTGRKKILRVRNAFHDSGLYIKVLRLQHMKRVALQVLTRKNQADETALSVVALVLSGRDQQAGSKNFYTVKGVEGCGTVDAAREQQMKETVEKMLTKFKRLR